ncbi:toxic anion resistance protein [Sphingomonas sp. MMS24-JH45]
MDRDGAAGADDPPLQGHGSGLQDKANELDATDPAKAKAIRETALFDARQRDEDLLTQMAVTVQGYLALDLVKKNNVELIKGVDRASTTTVARAAHCCDRRAGADQPEELALEQVTQLNTTTANMIDFTGKLLRQNTAAILDRRAGRREHDPARDAAARVPEHLRHDGRDRHLQAEGARQHEDHRQRARQRGGEVARLYRARRARRRTASPGRATNTGWRRCDQRGGRSGRAGARRAIAAAGRPGCPAPAPSARRSRGMKRRVVTAAAVNATILVVAGLFGGIVMPLGMFGALAVMLAMLAATVAILFGRDPGADPRADRALGSEGAAGADRALDRRATPRPPRACGTAASLDRPPPRRSACNSPTLYDDAPAAFEIRRLVGEQLPEFIRYYQRVPEAMRRTPRNGKTPDQQLAEGLGVIDREIGEMSERLAQGDLDALETKQRYLGIRYAGDEGA